MEKEKRKTKGMLKRLMNNQNSKLPIYLNAIDMHQWLKSFISSTPRYPSSCFWNGGNKLKSIRVQTKKKLKEKN
jgi:hypothetical protein